MSNRRAQAQKSNRPSSVTGLGAVNGKSRATQAFLLDGPRSTRVPSSKAYKRPSPGKGWQ